MSVFQPPALITTNSSRREVSAAFETPFCIGDAPTAEFSEGRYVVRFARTEEEIDAALRLRFEVFNLELNEGLEASYINERDEDKFDQTCHHLIVLEKSGGAVIGTYRVRTLE